MKRPSFCLLALTAVVLAPSCDKNNPPATTPDPPKAKKHLSKITTTSYGASETVYVNEFTYDAQYRVTEHAFQHIKTVNGTPVVDAQKRKFTFEYSGDNTLPVRAVNSTQDGIPPTYMHYRYNGQQKYQDSFSVVSGIKRPSDKIAYYHATDKIVSVQSRDMAIEGIVQHVDTIYLQNNNVPRVSYNGFDNLVRVYNNVLSFTYDEKHNPYYDLNIRHAFYLNGDKWHSGLFEGLSVNNIRVVTHSSNGTPTGGDFEFIYTYDADGYPLTAKRTEKGNPAKVMAVSAFEYIP